MAKSVFLIGQSCEEDRPMVLTFENPQDGLSASAMSNYRIARLKANSHVSGWTAWDNLICAVPGTTQWTEWDYYYFNGTAGCISRRALDILSPYLTDSFAAQPTTLKGGGEYYILVAIRAIDCLNLALCSPSFPKEIDVIERHKFALSEIKDPQIFTIPLHPYYLYCTESVVGVIHDSGLRGFELTLLDDGST